MKKILLIIIILLLQFPSTGFSNNLVCETTGFTCPEVQYDELIERDNKLYKKFTSEPFTGNVVGREQGKMIDGKREGVWVRYYDNGQLKHKTTYKNGKINGKYVSYRKTGELWNEGTMIMNKQEGVWKSFKIDGSYFKPYSGIFKNGNKIRELD